jgi:acyl-coenzyme A thioesterase PaaI-like protein
LDQHAINRPNRFEHPGDGWVIDEEEGFTMLIGPFWRRPEGDGVAFGLVTEERHRNRAGVVHGGVLEGFLDRAMGINISGVRGGSPQATIQLDVHFMRGAPIGTFLVARTTIDHMAVATTFASGLVSADDQPVASGRGVWKSIGRTPAPSTR